MIDVHAHILANLDDGPSDIEESVNMCRMAAEDGISVIVATPHMFKDIYPVSRQDVIDRTDELNVILADRKIDLKILPGAEIAIIPDVVGRLIKGEILTIGDRGSHVFIELTDYFPEKEIGEMIAAILQENVIPVISHPERNVTIQKHLNLLEGFVEMGALSQVTAMSITGDFGYHVQKCVKEILKRGLSHFIATDSHSSTWRPPLLSAAVKKASRVIGREKAIEQVTGAGLGI